MRYDKDTYKSLMSSLQHMYEPAKIEEAEQKVEEVEEENDDINKISDKNIADMVIRYNQVVNNALRAKFASRTRRKSL
jgi:hypothetical protein